MMDGVMGVADTNAGKSLATVTTGRAGVPPDQVIGLDAVDRIPTS